MEHGLCVFSREIFQGIQTGKTTKINTYFCPEGHPGFALRETGMIRSCPTTICGTRGYLWNPRAAVHDMDVEYAFIFVQGFGICPITSFASGYALAVLATVSFYCLCNTEIIRFASIKFFVKNFLDSGC